MDCGSSDQKRRALAVSRTGAIIDAGVLSRPQPTVSSFMVPREHGAAGIERRLWSNGAPHRHGLAMLSVDWPGRDRQIQNHRMSGWMSGSKAQVRAVPCGMAASMSVSMSGKMSGS